MTDWPTRTGTAACLIFAALLLCVLVLSGCEPSKKGTTPNQPSPKESGSPPTEASSGAAAEEGDRVDGTLTVNGNQVSLKHLYAWTSKGAFDDAKTDVHILITDRPVPEEKLKSSMGPVMPGDGPQGVELRIDEDKKVIEGEVYHSALQHGYFSGTGHIFEPVSFDRSAIEGRVHSDGAQDAFGDKWEYSASFRAKVRSDK